MRISDWSSDVCSSDLTSGKLIAFAAQHKMAAGRGDAAAALRGTSPRLPGAGREQTALGTTFGGLLIDEPNSQARRRRPLSRTAGPQALCRRHSRQAAAVMSSPRKEQAPPTRPDFFSRERLKQCATAGHVAVGRAAPTERLFL